MKIEFNLSEKEVEIEELGKMFFPEDVKEFIRLLKIYFTTKQSRDFINKLAGEKLK